MAFKCIVFSTMLVAAHAGFITGPATTSYSSNSLSFGSTLSNNALASHYSYVAPTAYAASTRRNTDAGQDAPAQYDFEYSVQDSDTGDFKNHREVRQGDNVRGSYSLIEADGSRRTVEYTVDENSGFNAVVHREPAARSASVTPASQVIPVTPITPYSATPVAHYPSESASQHLASPVSQHFAVPVAHYSASPVVHYSAAPVHQYSAIPTVSYTSYVAPRLGIQH